MMRRTLLPTVAIAVLAGGWGAIWFRAEPAPDATEMPAARSAGRGSIAKAPSRLAETLTSRQESSKDPARGGVPVTEAMTLSADSSALVAEQAALQLLARDSGLELTAGEWSALADATLAFQAIRQAYEATLARATVVKPGLYQLEIPAYPVAGDALREKFYAELHARLGPTADDVVTRLGSALEGRFAGFGVGVQTLDFTADPSGAENEYQVTRTTHYWNSVEASDRLTTRRETCFPGIEDPAGYTWGPFLSVLAAHVTAKAGS